MDNPAVRKTDPSHSAARDDPRLNATLIDRREDAPGLCTVRLVPDAGVPAFWPGQFLRLGLPHRRLHGLVQVGIVQRAYSVASSPREHGFLEIYLVKVPAGHLTPELWQLNPGDRLWVAERLEGEFTLRAVPNGHDLIMVATGTGIAPYVSMLRAHTGEGRWRRFVLVHGARCAADLGYREELEELARRDRSVVYLPMLSREPAESEWSGLRGRVQQVFNPQAYETLLGSRLDPASAHVFLCGNPEMVRSVREMLTPLGFSLATRHQAGTLHTERYW